MPRKRRHLVLKERPLSSSNVYDDARRAVAYATLELPGTYYLAYRDLPNIIAEIVTGRVALDFGCGTGRSTRFLKSLGFDALGSRFRPAWWGWPGKPTGKDPTS